VKIVVEGVSYPVADLSKLKVSIRLLSALEEQIGMTLDEVNALADMAKRLDPAATRKWSLSSEGLKLAGVSIWLALWNAGKQVTWEYVIDLPFTEVFQEEPGDVIPLEAAGKPRPRAGSVRGAGHQPKTARPKAKASGKRSAAAS